MNLKKAKEFFKNINKTPLEIGEKRYESIKEELRDQFLTVSDYADVLYVIQFGKVRLKIVYTGNNQSEISEINSDINSGVNRLEQVTGLKISGPSMHGPLFGKIFWYIDIGSSVGRVYPVKEGLPWKSIY